MSLCLFKRCKSHYNSVGLVKFYNNFVKFSPCPVGSENEKLYKWKQPDGHNTGIKIANAYRCLGKKKDSRVPLVIKDREQIKWYSCGPTVYDSPHIGHASSYIRFDAIRRILSSYFGYNVAYVMGITDIDDKIITRAALLNKEFLSMAAFYEEEFKVAMNNLNVLPPLMYVRVSDILPQIILFISSLLKNNFAYQCKSGNVWFNVDGFTKLGRLNYIVEEWEESETSFVLSEKRSTKDFALWKAAKPGEPYWDAPWGKGRPGWHIECSTISSLVFGSNFDIHSGASDLCLHHECEIFQSEAFYACGQWVNYFLHSGQLFSRGSSSKMSKSLGNVVSINEFLKKYSADVLRFFCLSTNWNSHLQYDQSSILSAQKNIVFLQNFLTNCRQYIIGNLNGKISECEVNKMLEETKQNIHGFMNDNFNTANILSSMMKFCKAIDDLFITNPNEEDYVSEMSLCRQSNCIMEVDIFVTEIFSTLGFTSITAQGTRVEPNRLENNFGINKQILDDLQTLRTKIRKIAINVKDKEVANQLFETSDEIRRKVVEKGGSVKDIKL